MADTIITTPDGRRFRVSPPEGPSIPGMAQQFASGGSSGVLSTLDIVPRGIAAGINLAGRAVGLNPGLDVSPFTRIGAMMGLGRRAPQSPAEEKAGFAGEVLGASMLPAAGAVGMSTAPLRAAAIEAAAAGGAIAGGLAGEEIAGKPGRVLGTIAGGFVPTAAPLLARTAVAPRGQAQMPQRLEAATRQQVPITAGEAAGGSFLEKGASTLPGGQRLAREFAERQAQAFQSRIGAMARNLGVPEASAEAAGRAIRRGLEGFTDRFRARGNELYAQADALIPLDTPTALNRTREALGKLIRDPELSNILDPPLIRQLNKTLAERGTVPYDVARAVRSRVGEKLAGPELIADAPKGQLKALYGALSDDLDDVAGAIGPQAEAAAKRASTFWRGGMRRIDDFLNPIARSKMPERVYSAAMSGTQEGASRIRALRKSLDPEQWNVVVGTVIRRLGRTKPSERTMGAIGEEAADFSPETFLTNLERMDPAARRVLFTGSRYQILESNINDLLTIAQGIRGQRQAAYNPSGTAAGLANVGGIVGPGIMAYFNPATAARIGAGLATAPLARRALQSPAVAQWMANPTAFYPGALGQIARPLAILPPPIGIPDPNAITERAVSNVVAPDAVRAAP